MNEVKNKFVYLAREKTIEQIFDKNYDKTDPLAKGYIKSIIKKINQRKDRDLLWTYLYETSQLIDVERPDRTRKSAIELLERIIFDKTDTSKVEKKSIKKEEISLEQKNENEEMEMANIEIGKAKVSKI